MAEKGWFSFFQEGVKLLGICDPSQKRNFPVEFFSDRQKSAFWSRHVALQKAKVARAQKQIGTWSSLVPKALWQSIFPWAWRPFKLAGCLTTFFTSHMAIFLLPLQGIRPAKGNGCPSNQVASTRSQKLAKHKMVCHHFQAITPKNKGQKAP